LHTCRIIYIQVIPTIALAQVLPRVTASHPRFTSEINHLREENTKLGEEVSRRQEEAAVEASVRQRLEKKLDQLEVDLSSSRVLVDRLTKENMHLASKVRRQTKRFGRSAREIKRALQALHT
jgi:predicted nuclease with TOPRIM domain